MPPQGSLSELVELSSVTRTGQGLLSRALPLPPGWETGVRFRPAGCELPTILGDCVVADAPLPDRVAEGVEVRPVYIRQTATCSMLSMTLPGERAEERLIGTTEWGLGRLLAAGFDGLDNPSFADAVSVAETEDPVAALSCLEQAVADLGYGNRAFLHSPYRAAAYLRDRWGINDQYQSPSGHQWVVSAGYPGGDTDTVTIWATGPVWAAIGALQTYDRRNAVPNFRMNDDDAYSQRLALAAFDPCINLSATFAAAACTGGS
jgi:hypothetical protein